MAMIEISDLQFTYPGEESPVLKQMNLSIESGSLVLLCGSTGCGKTTLLRHLIPELLPVGAREGSVRFQGVEMVAESPSKAISAGEIGMVMQHPESQIVMEDVRQELVFGLENLGLPTETIRGRMAEIAQFFGMESWIDHKVEQLSGGQMQLLNLASVLIMQPKVLLLDEPTAQLDPIAAKQFIEAVRRLNQELGMTVVMCEHRLEEALLLADRVLVMADGVISFDGEPAEALQFMGEQKKAQFAAYLPSVTKLQHGLLSAYPEARGAENSTVMSVKEGRRWFAEFMKVQSGERMVSDRPQLRPQMNSSINSSVKPSLRSPMLTLSNIVYRYQPDEPAVLNRLSLQVFKDEWMALLGGNGAGKTTLFNVALGLLKPQQGQMMLEGKRLHAYKEQELYRRLGFLPQNPMALFVCETVEEELLLSSARWPGTKEEQALAMARMIANFQLHSCLHRHPHDLSGGERQKAALACVLLGQPKLLFIDEPTKGLDPLAKQALKNTLKALHQGGLTIVMVTHDVEFAAATATRCALLFDGEIASEGSPRQFFSQHYFYTTAINRMVRDHFPYAINAEDVGVE